MSDWAPTRTLLPGEEITAPAASPATLVLISHGLARVPSPPETVAVLPNAAATSRIVAALVSDSDVSPNWSWNWSSMESVCWNW